jgi:DNA primase
MSIIPEEIINQIRERTNIAELISEMVTLKRSGRGHVGLCPFHSEKSPSFHVYEDDGVRKAGYHCFGCSKHGDAVSFVMETRSLSYPEAIRFLAKRVGVTIPEANAAESKRRALEAKRAKISREIFEDLTKLYHKCLTTDATAGKARDYLRSRQVSDATIERFRIGFAPEGEMLESRLRSSNITEHDLQPYLRAYEQLGLIKRKNREVQPNQSAFYDTFAGRVIFPISRSDGKTIAFGGRLLAAAENRPKYINSPETPLYRKRRSFFGLHTAVPAARLNSAGNGSEIFVVEGYMDVLAMFQAGFENTVATCGTALTPEHVSILKRIADRVIIVYDGDAAGRKGAKSCLETFLNSGIEVQAVALPEGEDPGSLFEQRGALILQEQIQSSKKPLLEHYFDAMFDAQEDVGAVKEGKRARDLCAIAARIRNPVERELFVRSAAARVGVSEESLFLLLREVLQAASQKDKSQPSIRRLNNRFNNRASASANFNSSVVETRGRDSETRLSKYFEQLIISVLAEPRLAETVLEMPTLAAPVPDNIQGFLQEMTQLEEFSLSRLKESAVDEHSPEYLSVCNKLLVTLDRYNIPGHALIKECLRQLRVGGVEQKRIVSELDLVTTRNKLSSEVEQIRVQERVENNQLNAPNTLEELVQAKLLKKRQIDLLRNSPRK